MNLPPNVEIDLSPEYLDWIRRTFFDPEVTRIVDEQIRGVAHKMMELEIREFYPEIVLP
jgi:hypothetical protein